jgi:hypothetical protein
MMTSSNEYLAFIVDDDKNDVTRQTQTLYKRQHPYEKKAFLYICISDINIE